MSSSSRSFTRVAGPMLTAVLALAVAFPSAAADSYFIPFVEASTEYYLNRDLTTAPSPFPQDIPGYILTVGGTGGVRTPRSSTEVRPLLRLQQFPDRADLATTNGSLDLRSIYDSELSRFELRGRYLRQDRTNRQLLEAGFDAFDPNQPVADGVGRVTLRSETLNDTQLRPSFTHRLSPRVGIGFGGLYQQVSFSAEGEAVGVDFRNAELNTELLWELRERTALSTGVYFTNYETSGRLDNLTRSSGVSAELDHDWSQRLKSTITMAAEIAEVQVSGGPSDRSRNVALSFDAVSRGIVDQWRLSAGRSFSPTGFGTRNTVDQVRLQYVRSLSARLRWQGAARFLRSRAQGRTETDNRTYGRLESELQWSLTRTWYLIGAYSFTRQEFTGEPKPGTGHMVAVRVRYQGLSPQR